MIMQSELINWMFVSAFSPKVFIDLPSTLWPTIATTLVASVALYDDRDFEILKFLASHPAPSIADIARNLHYRCETVSNHLRLMRRKKLYNGTMALLCYQKLDLAYVPVLIQAPIGKLPTIYQACRAHPYIEYSVRTLGATDGGFLVFTIPRGAVGQLIEFLDELASRGVITNHRIYVCDDTRRDFMKPDLQVHDRQSGTWNFNWNKWVDAEAANETRLAQLPLLKPRIIRPETYNLGRVEMQVLSILSDDANLGTDEIGKVTGLPPHTVRRTIQSLEDNGFVIGYRAMIAFSKLHLPNSMLFDCDARPDAVETCKRRLLELPFPGFVLPVQNGFLCQATLPPEGLPPVHRFLARNCSDVRVSWYDLATSDVAKLNWQAYEDEAWRVDREYMIDQPLLNMRKSDSDSERALIPDQVSKN